MELLICLNGDSFDIDNDFDLMAMVKLRKLWDLLVQASRVDKSSGQVDQAGEGKVDQ